MQDFTSPKNDNLKNQSREILNLAHFKYSELCSLNIHVLQYLFVTHTKIKRDLTSLVLELNICSKFIF